MAIALIEVHSPAAGGRASAQPLDAARSLCERLEQGDILLLRESPLLPAAGDRDFLLTVRQAGAAYHKNIAYRPSEDRVTGFSRTGVDGERLRRVMGAYSRQTRCLVNELFAPYSRAWRIDFASYRPVEEEGRQLPLKARNDLLHIDAFSTRPTNGSRIVRVFTNIHTSRSRVWSTGEPFEVQARRMAMSAGLADFAAEGRSSGIRFRPLLTRVANSIGLPLKGRSPYDRFMRRFHHYLKANREFQENSPQWRFEFPPGSTWIVFTDAVLHAVLSGQFALEQTFLVPLHALVLPVQAPVKILEELCGTALLS